jgi:hypothetical protein
MFFAARLSAFVFLGCRGVTWGLSACVRYLKGRVCYHPVSVLYDLGRCRYASCILRAASVILLCAWRGSCRILEALRRVLAGLQETRR